MAQINRLASEDLDKSYRPEIGSAKPASYKPQPKPEAVNPDEVQPGDIVTPLLTPGDSYEVLTIMPNRILDCKSLRTGVQMGMRPTAVSLVQKVQPTEKIEFNDLIEVIADGNDCVGLVGAFGRVKIIGESRIGVEIDEQLTYFKPSELRIKAKEERTPQRQALQSGQQLMGDRIVTSGNYVGQGRISQMLNAKLRVGDKLAAIELAKNLKDLGLDPQLAVMAAVDDASDF
jgi:preprotein translocase subunit YajC